MGMSDERMFKALKLGIGSFGARRAAHEDELLDRIMNEFDANDANEISDDELELLAAAGTIDAMLGDMQTR